MVTREEIFWDDFREVARDEIGDFGAGTAVFGDRFGTIDGLGEFCETNFEKFLLVRLEEVGHKSGNDFRSNINTITEEATTEDLFTTAKNLVVVPEVVVILRGFRDISHKKHFLSCFCKEHNEQLWSNFSIK